LFQRIAPFFGKPLIGIFQSSLFKLLLGTTSAKQGFGTTKRHSLFRAAKLAKRSSRRKTLGFCLLGSGNITGAKASGSLEARSAQASRRTGRLLQSRPVGFGFNHTLTGTTESLGPDSLGGVLLLRHQTGTLNIAKRRVDHLLGVWVLISLHGFGNSLRLRRTNLTGKRLGLRNGRLASPGSSAKHPKGLLLLWRKARHQFASIRLVRPISRRLCPAINIQGTGFELRVNTLSLGLRCGLLSAALTHGVISLETVVIIPVNPCAFKARTHPGRPVPVSLVHPKDRP
jgi:hypothetical protein